ARLGESASTMQPAATKPPAYRAAEGQPTVAVKSIPFVIHAHPWGAPSARPQDLFLARNWNQPVKERSNRGVHGWLKDKSCQAGKGIAHYETDLRSRRDRRG